MPNNFHNQASRNRVGQGNTVAREVMKINAVFAVGSTKSAA
jgi:hypothetical protein